MCLARFKNPLLPQYFRDRIVILSETPFVSRRISATRHNQRPQRCFRHNSGAPLNKSPPALLINRIRLHLQIIEQLQIGILLVVAVERLQVAHRRAGLRHSEITGQRVVGP